MKPKELIWIKKAYIGQQILFSNTQDRPFQIIFIGAEELSPNKECIIHLALCYLPCFSSTTNISPTGFSVCLQVKVAPQEKIRFESFFGIHETVTVEYRDEEKRSFMRFFPVKDIRFHRIEKDYIEYEIHCK